jgi:hypothetical protein
MMKWAEGYSTFHRWHISTWLLTLVTLNIFQSVGPPPWLHYMAPEAKLIAQTTKQSSAVRELAFVGFVVLTPLWLSFVCRMTP